MTFSPPRIYPITDTRISGLTHVEQVRRLVEGGATLIQLREKHASPAEFFSAAEPAVEFAREHQVKIIINDRVDIALGLRADGVHLGQDDLPATKARDILGPLAIIGLSTHTPDQARAACDLPVDYVAFGPVFPTATKQDPEPTVGVEVLRSIRSLIGAVPLVAIGGIGESEVNIVLNAGADSAAVINALLADPDQMTKRMQNMLNAVGNC